MVSASGTPIVRGCTETRTNLIVGHLIRSDWTVVAEGAPFGAARTLQGYDQPLFRSDSEQKSTQLPLRRPAPRAGVPGRAPKTAPQSEPM